MKSLLELSSYKRADVRTCLIMGIFTMDILLSFFQETVQFLFQKEHKETGEAKFPA